MPLGGFRCEGDFFKKRGKKGERRGEGEGKKKEKWKGKKEGKSQNRCNVFETQTQRLRQTNARNGLALGVLDTAGERNHVIFDKKPSVRCLGDLIGISLREKTERTFEFRLWSVDHHEAVVWSKASCKAGNESPSAPSHTAGGRRGAEIFGTFGNW